MAHEPIDDRQRDAVSARLLRAFAAEYRRAKRYRALRLGGSLLLALGGPLASIASITAAGVVGAVAGAWVLVTRLLLIPVEKTHVRSGVRIQELFDTRLFDLEWPESLAGARPSEEDISDAARRVMRSKKVTQQLDEGWYPTTRNVPWPVDVLLSQWSSIAYGRHQSLAYFRFLTTATVSAAAGVIIFGIATAMSLTDWLITFALPALPGLLDVSEVAVAHRHLAGDKANLESEVLQPLWRGVLKDPAGLTAQECRRVQDESFRMRSLGLQVPDWFFWRRRGRSESNMHDACEVRRDEYLEATA